MSDTTPGTPRFLALGDSYTIGEGVGPSEAWPTVLAAALRKDGLGVADPEIVAVTGWTVAELDAGIDEADPKEPFALVTLLIGVNDQYHDGAAVAYRPAFRAMLARAVGFAGGEAHRVVVLAIPDWGATPFAEDRDRAAIGAALDAFNAVAFDETHAAGARWVDVAPVSRQFGATETAPDGLHPSGALYARWARLAAPEARAALAGARE